MQKPNCPQCRKGRKCEKGRKLHAEATRYLLENGLEFDEKHKELIDKYLKHEPNGHK